MVTRPPSDSGSARSPRSGPRRGKSGGYPKPVRGPGCSTPETSAPRTPRRSKPAPSFPYRPHLKQKHPVCPNPPPAATYQTTGELSSSLALTVQHLTLRGQTGSSVPAPPPAARPAQRQSDLLKCCPAAILSRPVFSLYRL